MDRETAKYFEKIRFKEIPTTDRIIEEPDEENNEHLNEENDELVPQARPSEAKKNWNSAIQKVKTQNIIKSGVISILACVEFDTELQLITSSSLGFSGGEFI